MVWEPCAGLAVHGFIPSPPSRVVVEMTYTLDLQPQAQGSGRKLYNLSELSQDNRGH